MTASLPPGSQQDRRKFHRFGRHVDWVTVLTASPFWVGITRAFRAGAYPAPLPREARPPHYNDNAASPAAFQPDDAPEVRPALRLVAAGETLPE